MDRPRDHYSKWSKPEREIKIYDITYIWNLKKMIKMKIYTHNRNRHRKNTMVQKGKVGGGIN